MKRTQINRTPWKRKPSKKARQLSTAKADGTFQDFQDWRAKQTHCYFCHWKLGTPRIHSGWLTRLEANHVFGAALRGATRFEIWAIVMLCQWCHQEVWPRFKNRARVLFGAALKLENDWPNFKLDEMNDMTEAEDITLTELEAFLDTDLPAIRRNLTTKGE